VRALSSHSPSLGAPLIRAPRPLTTPPDSLSVWRPIHLPAGQWKACRPTLLLSFPSTEKRERKSVSRWMSRGETTVRSLLSCTYSLFLQVFPGKMTDTSPGLSFREKERKHLDEGRDVQGESLCSRSWNPSPAAPTAPTAAGKTQGFHVKVCPEREGPHAHPLFLGELSLPTHLPAHFLEGKERPTLKRRENDRKSTNYKISNIFCKRN